MIVLLLACTGEPSSADVCADADALTAGSVVATLDGAAWSSTATWLWQGDSLQVNTATADGWRFSIVAQTLAEDTTIKSAADAGSFPIEVQLAEGGGGWALAYPDDGDSLTTGLGGGTLTLSALEGDALYACFSFEAASAATTLSAESGAFNAEPF